MSEQSDRGAQKRRRVLGDAYVDASLRSADAFMAPLQELITEFCWGWLWTREGLDDKQRSLNTLCILAAMDRGAEFQTHLRGALRNGCTVPEIRETLLHVAVYAGIPAGIQAFRLAREILGDRIDESSPAE